MLLMLNVAVLLLVSVTVCAALVVPTCWLPKLRLVVERVAFGGREAAMAAKVSPVKMVTTNRTGMPAQQMCWLPRLVSRDFISSE